MKLDVVWSDDFNLIEQNHENPFVNRANLEVLSNYYNLDLIKIDLLCDGKLDASGFFFCKTVGKGTHIFSGGRFGFLGFAALSGNSNLAEYLPLIEKSLQSLNPITFCITGSYLCSKYFKETATGWSYKEICYLVAEVSQSVDENGPKFLKAKNKKNLRRNLKKAKMQVSRCRITSEEEDITEWYNSCHLVRISELDGRIWEYKILLDLIKFGSGELAVVEDKNGKIIGGCVFLCSTEVLELFMMSTPRAYLESGVNYMLTEYLYNFAFKNKLKFINWQASNPPVGSLVSYKKSWNCSEMVFPVYSKIYDSKLNRKYFEENFSDCYVFPFEHLDGD